ncbi:NAD(P)H-hydrate dehydratase [Mechercharimyces sp. CAU 1602]|uniref:NAD(P)H-hydrate dehydratase n=1 Tax=Mechercharimyces sp. CAU 1602 TaxID=2973933 RepID=UPI002161C68D|nr:NAD(P)H-hydrate dehydratase [Mechercharimyces sp. CAU 1602]MCS1352144.1 NAD(P)H-hydrate dehydratase [Mechercharimyces sp. CAU 1602]
MYVVTAQEMREIDRLSSAAFSIPGVVLMERAGLAVSQAVQERYTDGRVLILAGGGNNGGDGFVTARHLQQAGWDVQVWIVGSRARMSADTTTFLEACEALDIPIGWYEEEKHSLFLQALATVDGVVDALLGTGLSGEVRPSTARVISAINEAGLNWVVAVDVPSGVDVDRGKSHPVCIHADLTITFAFPKWGHYLFPTARYCGEIIVADIGIPTEVVRLCEPEVKVNHPHLWQQALRQREKWGHKGTYGHVLIVGGAQGMVGAAEMAGIGALRSGAGKVTLAVPAWAEQVMASKVTEAMVWAWPDNRGKFTIVPTATELKQRDITAIAVGPGLGRFSTEGEWLRTLLQQAEVPLVLDADALNILSLDPDWLCDAQDVVLTPHPGEMARLLGISIAEVEAARHQVARDFALRYGVTVVLKGTYTIIAYPDGKQVVNPTGNPALAKGGSGDILTGMIGALLARSLPLQQAVAMSVYLHGKAAESAAGTKSAHSVVATEVAAEIGVLLQQLESMYAPR